MGRVACRLRGGHETEVVIAVGGLGGPALTTLTCEVT
jgi:hypothetical protein